MSKQSQEPVEKVNKFITEKNPTGIKPCCACPEEKQRRDDCFFLHGKDSPQCAPIFQSYIDCMAKLGFDLPRN